MPVIVVAEVVKFENGNYYVDIDEVRSILPHIKEGGSLKLYVIEIRDENNKLVKRFKPFKELTLKVCSYFYYNYSSKCICIPADLASDLNICVKYRVSAILTAYNGKPLLPFEVRPVKYEVASIAKSILESLSRIEADLLLLSLEQAALNKAVSYLWEAHFRLEEGDVEGARVSVRNALQVLIDEFVPVIEVKEESKEFPNKLKGLISKLKEFVHYGGPHPGPAPRTTTEMVISMTVELIRYLAKALEVDTISVKPSA